MDGLTVARELFGTCQLLKDGGALVLSAAQEVGELPLREHCHPVELLERKPDGGFCLLTDVFVLCPFVVAAP